MAIKIGSNFTFQGKQPNFERDRFATKAAMKAFPETSIDDGHLSYCAEDGNTYQFKSSNSVDTVTGKWRVFKADVDLSAYATKDSVATGLDKKVDIAGVKATNNLNDKNAYLKVLTITIPNTQYQIGLLDIVMIDRSSNKINVSITIDNTSKNNPLVKVIETIDRIDIVKQPLYYYKDFTSDAKAISLYFKMTPYDYVSVKVVNKGGNMPFIYTLDLQTQEVLPEGVIQVHNINYNYKNLFYATPKDAAGDPTFRAIDITDLPDLSSKYATKEKAFTKDTASTEPNQFLAGPINTRGNISLRKIDISDIPNLGNKYQKIDNNGAQQYPNLIRPIIGASPEQLYLIARVNTINNYKASPDWYFATDGTLQDIKTKIPKVVLDDAVSTTSDNGVKNSVITEYVDSKVTTINSSIADVRTSLESTQTDFVDLRSKVNAMPKTVFITQAAYNALTTKDANTIYYING